MVSIPVLVTSFAVWAIVAPAAALSPHQAAVAPKPSAEATGPLLSIAVDNGRTAVAAGDELTYTVKVRNLGTTETKQLEISQSLPAGLTFVSADHGGAARDGRVTWSVDLKPGQESPLATVARVGETPSELLRLATVACATAKGGSKPLVCATHSDLLPAGAAAGRVHQSTPALVVLGLAAVLLIRRRRRRRAAPTSNHRADPAGLIPTAASGQPHRGGE
jgi:uncharacterized repeat protein (TIGR01451 family)